MIQQEIKRLQKRYSLEEQLNQLLRCNLETITYTKDFDQYIADILPLLSNRCFRVHVCNRIGNQLSGKHIKQRNSSWKIYNLSKQELELEAFFLQNIVNMEMNQKGFLSDLYKDIETTELI